ncbi:hypothetical protein BASA81_006669 [Batrachochytrium salamandrivorans]|nr:hypothetical protein BASA81_006669 [Batrachochytrium salamandrivorans]
MMLLWVVALGLAQALQMDAVFEYPTRNCSGTATQTYPVSPTNQCFSTESDGSAKSSCGKYTTWSAGSCLGNGYTVLLVGTCVPSFSNKSYTYSCAEFQDVVKLQFRYGDCQAEILYDAYAELNKCTPVTGQQFAPTYTGLTNSRSYMVQQTTSGEYAVQYYYDVNCAGENVATFPQAHNRLCVTTGSGSGTSASSQQSVTVVAVSVGGAAPSSATELFARWWALALVVTALVGV